jgi:hypothetical protein
MPKLQAPMNGYITVSIPFDGVPYCYDGCDIYLAARQAEWPYDAVDEEPVSANWTYAQAGIYGDRLMCLLDGIRHTKMQFFIMSR